MIINDATNFEVYKRETGDKSINKNVEKVFRTASKTERKANEKNNCRVEHIELKK